MGHKQWLWEAKCHRGIYFSVVVSQHHNVPRLNKGFILTIRTAFGRFVACAWKLQTFMYTAELRMRPQLLIPKNQSTTALYTLLQVLTKELLQLLIRGQYRQQIKNTTGFEIGTIRRLLTLSPSLCATESKSRSSSEVVSSLCYLFTYSNFPIYSNRSLKNPESLGLF